MNKITKKKNDKTLKEKKLNDRDVLYSELLKSEERYRSLVEKIPVGIFRSTVTQPGRFLQANLALAQIHGLESIDLLLEIPVENLYANPSDRKALLHDILKYNSVKAREISYKTITGEIIWCSITAVCHRDENGEPDWIDGILEDVTEKKRTELNLSTNLKLLETLIDNINSPIFYTDIDGRYIGCNKIFAELIIGLPREDIINKTVFDLQDVIPSDLAEKYDEQDKKLISMQGVQNYESRIKCSDGITRHFIFNKAVYRRQDGNVAGIVGVMVDITDRVNKEMELKKINEEMEIVFGSISSIIIGVSIADRITHWNKLAESIFNIKSVNVIGRQFNECNIKWDWDSIYEGIGICISDSKNVRLDNIKYIRPDGRDGVLGLSINQLKSEGDITVGFIILGRDLTEQVEMEHRLQQSRKLEAIGQLAAGVAHEINSPLQYVGDNLKFISNSMSKVIEFQKRFLEQMESSSSWHESQDDADSLHKFIKEIDLNYLMQEMPKAIDQSLDGVIRVSKIIQSMKVFAHPGSGSKSPVNINTSLENTVTVSRNEWKYDSELKLDLDSSLPQVPCFQAELNQVILNLIVNAADAVKEAKQKGLIERGLIIITTRQEGDQAVIRVTDNGAGIPENIRQKIFDPFFTTKEVGKGSGQGLAISHSIIVERHRGEIYCESKEGKGTSFIIKLPMK